ncbi:YqaA family protein [Methanococcus voltae]|uniref:SNARE associated Golgi protein-related protein n=1 Tax=Methanococcus voltae (strain ATCC BAA-1334 / A3) TaxID=456320 RepID=D7DRX6_METV3|nr:YqaA family protein [Methanococcus voltae]MCS3901411.1 membrane protein YqaA with SNARE-associated domain [Methanococcus voltae]
MSIDLSAFINPFIDFGLYLVHKYGLWAIFLLGFSESIFQPFPTEIFMIPGLTIGLNWFWVLVASTVGSTLGAVITYYLASKYGERLYRKFFKSDKYYDKTNRFLEKWGPMGLIIVGITPIPFELICWSASAFKMPFKTYIIAVFVSRVLKHGIIVAPFGLYAFLKSYGIWPF